MVSESTLFIVAVTLFTLIVASLASYSSSKQQPGATETVPPVNYTNGTATITTMNVSAELNNSLNEGFMFNYSVFSANSSSDCELVRISQCWNNAPSQAVCINKAYQTEYQRQFGGISNMTGPVICPMYFVSGNLSCGLSDGYCVLVQASEQQ